MAKLQKCRLRKIETDVLKKIKHKKVKNIETPIWIGGKKALHPKTGKPLTASRVNLSTKEAITFRKLERKGLISAFGRTEYFTNFKLTKKGKDILKICV